MPLGWIGLDLVESWAGLGCLINVNKEIILPSIQAYVDDELFTKIENEANKSGLTVSKYLLDWVAHALSSEKFVAEKTHQLLGHVLSCVYDEDIRGFRFY